MRQMLSGGPASKGGPGSESRSDIAVLHVGKRNNVPALHTILLYATAEPMSAPRTAKKSPTASTKPLQSDSVVGSERAI
jgi:hypothetical protein